MKKILLIAIFSLCILFSPTMQAFANSQSYVVAPFQINGSEQYQYLQNSFASMLSSRLFTQGQYETASNQDSMIKSDVPTNKTDAQKLLEKSKADFIFYGSITIMGSQASIDVISLDKNGKQVQEGQSTTVDGLISSVQTIADKLKISVFALSSSNQDFVLTETGRTSMFVQTNTESQTSRLRSQVLDFATISMDLGDFNGDGVQDIVLGDSGRDVYLYEWNNGTMKKLAEYRIPSSQHILLVRSIKYEDKDLILLCTFTESQIKATSTILEFDGKKLKTFMKKSMPFFTNTYISPETGERVLIGQAVNTNGIFRGNVFEIEISKDGYTKGKDLENLPRNANIFNFAYLPNNKGKDFANLAVITSLEELQIVSPSLGSLYQTDESFSGGNAFMRTSNGNLTSSSTGDIIAYYYIPMRMVALDLHKNNNYELLINKPFSTRAKIFSNYRNYPEGEIQALYWDDYTLELNWKTELIKGTIADFQVGDPDANGTLDLVTCMVTYPGALGLGERKTVITLYPLDELAQ